MSCCVKNCSWSSQVIMLLILGTLFVTQQLGSEYDITYDSSNSFSDEEFSKLLMNSGMEVVMLWKLVTHRAMWISSFDNLLGMPHPFVERSGVQIPFVHARILYFLKSILPQDFVQDKQKSQLQFKSHVQFKVRFDAFISENFIFLFPCFPYVR